MRGAELDSFAVDLGGDERRPAVSHFVTDLRHGVIVRGHSAIGRPLAELAIVEAHVVRVVVVWPSGGRSHHLVGPAYLGCTNCH
jgi:hypothetical protein